MWARVALIAAFFGLLSCKEAPSVLADQDVVGGVFRARSYVETAFHSGVFGASGMNIYNKGCLSNSVSTEIFVGYAAHDSKCAAQRAVTAVGVPGFIFISPGFANILNSEGKDLFVDRAILIRENHLPERAVIPVKSAGAHIFSNFRLTGQGNGGICSSRGVDILCGSMADVNGVDIQRDGDAGIEYVQANGGDGGEADPRSLGDSHLVQLPAHTTGLRTHDVHLIGRRFFAAFAGEPHFSQLAPHNPELQDGRKHQCGREGCEGARPPNQVSIKLFLGLFGLFVAFGCCLLAAWCAIFWCDRRGWWMLTGFGFGAAFWLVFQFAPLAFYPP